QNVVAERVPLQFADQGFLDLVPLLEIDDACAMTNGLGQLIGRQGDRDGALAMPVDDGRDLALFAQLPRHPATVARALLGHQNHRLGHDCSSTPEKRVIISIRPPKARGAEILPQEIPARTMARNVSACKLAPPTRAPSTSGCASRTAALSGLTLPPY